MLEPLCELLALHKSENTTTGAHRPTHIHFWVCARAKLCRHKTLTHTDNHSLSYCDTFSGSLPMSSVANCTVVPTSARMPPTRIAIDRSSYTQRWCHPRNPGGGQFYRLPVGYVTAKTAIDL